VARTVPVNVYVDNDSRTKVAWLCDDNWRLPDQVEALWEWLQQNRASLSQGPYIADIGFSPRPDAAGGGSALSSEMLRALGEVGMDLHLSEYPSIRNSDDRAT